jgi:hypothetical protein
MTLLLKSGALPTVSKTLVFEPCQYILRNILYVGIIESLTDDIEASSHQSDNKRGDSDKSNLGQFVNGSPSLSRSALGSPPYLSEPSYQNVALRSPTLQTVTVATTVYSNHPQTQY